MTTYYLIALPNSGVAQQLVEEYCTVYICKFTGLSAE